MKFDIKYNIVIITAILMCSCKNKKEGQPIDSNVVNSTFYAEPYRPQFHFSPSEQWMNDPNGLVYQNGVYHLFYQYYPEDIVWGPMHWGHATSTDLIHWKHRPIALYPDKYGYIFSGSAVVDHQNSSGLGTMDNPPLVAIFTYHDMEGEQGGKNDYQTQGIAYSLDQGETWMKYEANPVIGNDGIKDFRDPKVFWNEQENLWSMLLVAGDHLQIWNSNDLKQWEKVSEFGKDKGAHGGVWECPDLFKLKVEGTDQEKWVLFISINPGAPNGGSGTQYFIGDFDGKRFTTDQTIHRWIDLGTDNYAGVTFNDAPGGERIFIGWMSNWLYAQNTPTEKWRSAMTLPRKLSLRKINDEITLVNYPVEEFDGIVKTAIGKELMVAVGKQELLENDILNQSEVRFTTASKDFKIAFGNQQDEQLVLRMDSKNQVFTLNRSASGKVDFQEDFGKQLQEMPIDNLPEGELELRMVLDRSSIEIFINKGQYVMTAQIFPNEAYTIFGIENTSKTELVLNNLKIGAVEGIWND